MYFQNSLEEAANPACKEIDLMQTDRFIKILYIKNHNKTYVISLFIFSIFFIPK